VIFVAYCWALDVIVNTDAYCVLIGHWMCTDSSGLRIYGIYAAEADIAHVPQTPASILTSDSSMSNGINQTIAKGLNVSF
jgi:hypothetical protein|tara:strand:+ start:893 stop:1132 length:240 start_codon:yes stop_codon:yes gene_type:complete